MSLGKEGRGVSEIVTKLMTKGARGVKNLKKLSDIICGSPLNQK